MELTVSSDLTSSKMIMQNYSRLFSRSDRILNPSECNSLHAFILVRARKLIRNSPFAVVAAALSFEQLHNKPSKMSNVWLRSVGHPPPPNGPYATTHLFFVVKTDTWLFPSTISCGSGCPPRLFEGLRHSSKGGIRCLRVLLYTSSCCHIIWVCYRSGPCARSSPPMINFGSLDIELRGLVLPCFPSCGMVG